MDILEQIEKLQSLFSGFREAYSLWYAHPPEKQLRPDKEEGNCPMIRKPWENKHWESHLEGRQPLSIVPLLEDNTCNYAAIDIDVYDIAAASIAKTVSTFKLPAIPCRTKSGGWHLYFFFDKPYPAQLVRTKLSSIAAHIGQAEQEIWPKQDSCKWDQGEVGNWLSLPYYGGDQTVRYAVDEAGKALTLEAFLSKAASLKVTLEELQAIKLELKTTEFSDGPCCLRMLAAKGIGPGMRNEVMFNAAIYYKKKFPETWSIELEKFNATILEPLPAEEILAIIKTHSKGKDYNYRCRTQPLKGCCDSQACRKKEFGVGDNGFAMALTALTKVTTEPATWFIDAGDGRRIQLATEDLLDQGRFRRSCVEASNFLPPLVEKHLWDSRIRDLLAACNVIDIPKEDRKSGLLEISIYEFLQSRQAADKEELCVGKPFTEDGSHFARMADIKAFLERKQMRIETREITNAMREAGGKPAKIRLRFRVLAVWELPARQEWIDKQKAQAVKDAEIPEVKTENY